MTAEEFLISFLECEPNNLEDVFCDQACDDIINDTINVMREYARLICDKQRVICAMNICEIVGNFQ